jgi:hypothetical protein
MSVGTRRAAKWDVEYCDGKTAQDHGMVRTSPILGLKAHGRCCPVPWSCF